MTSEELKVILSKVELYHKMEKPELNVTLWQLNDALRQLASEVPCPECRYRRPRSPAELSEGIPEWPKCSACNGTGNKYNLGVGDE